MLNIDIIFALVFYGVLLIYFLTHRRKFEMQGGIFALYRTKLGLKLMDRIAGISPRLLRIIGVVSVAVGFLGMLLMIYFLVIGAYGVLMGSAPILSPVLPGVKIATGLPELGFWHWVISIFIVAIIHEFSHGVFARLYDIKVKSSGFAFLGPILAAFVEPDEKKLVKKGRKAQLVVFSAGPFSNIVLGIIFLVITGFLGSAAFATLDFNGVNVTGFEEGSVLAKGGMGAGEVIKEINGVEIVSYESFRSASKEVKFGELVNVVSDKGSYNVYAGEHPSAKGKGYLGIEIAPMGFREEYKAKYGALALEGLYWLYLLCWWIYTISIGIGIFNLVPLGPVDGGRMLLTSLTRFMKEKRAKRVWNYISMVILLLIVINLLPWVIRFLTFALGLFSG